MAARSRNGCSGPRHGVVSGAMPSTADSLRFHDRPDTVPAAPGAYALLILLEAPLALDLPGKPAAVLAPGRYLYAGSARGPGGLRARVGRHFRREKPLRWHVDRLTTAGRMAGAWCEPGGDECALVAALAGLPVPVPGFGSSDCRACASHLLSWPEGAALPARFLPPHFSSGSPTIRCIKSPGP